jgi:hypothetical protein
MHYEDARILLEDVLHYEYSDSLLNVYMDRDSLNTNKITLQKDIIDNLNKENVNLQEMVNNLNKIIENKDKEIEYKDDTIDQQKNEIRKQKALKIFGLSGSVVLPIVIILLMI